MTQLSLKVEREPGTSPLVVRAALHGNDVLRATSDWSLERGVWVSSNGWRVRPAALLELGLDKDGHRRSGWVAESSDGVLEFWGETAAIAMERAEGGV